MTGPRKNLKYVLYTETFPSRDPASPRQTGIGRYCYDLADGIAALGHDMAVLTNASIGPREERQEEPFGVVAEGAAPQSFRERLRRRQWLDRMLRLHQADVVLAGDPAAQRVCALLESPQRARCWPIFYGSEVVQLAELWRISPSLGRWLRGRLVRRFLTSTAGRICISQYTARLLAQAVSSLAAPCIVYPSVSTLVLRHPADAELSRELRCRLTGSGASTVLLTVARISERKNQSDVLAAMAHAHQTGPVRFHYVMVGNLDSPQHTTYLETLKDFIRAHGLEQSVTFVPNATDEEKIAYIDSCDVFVMLSRTVGASIEGFGIAPIEASCRGKPVVVSDQGGMPETIIAGKTGYALPPGDTQQLARRLVELAQNEQMRSAMGAAGREFAGREFTPIGSARRLHHCVLSQKLTEDR